MIVFRLKTLFPLILLVVLALLYVTCTDKESTRPLDEKKDPYEPRVSWPVQREHGLESISSPYGFRYDPFTGAWVFHSGIDFALDYGEPVYSIAKGRVILASTSYPGFGTLLIIEHENYQEREETIRSLYGHCSQILVEEDQEIATREVVARVGSCGRSTGPHLHFEVHVYDDEAGWIHVDPIKYLLPPNS